MRFMLLMIPAGYESAGPELDLPVDRVELMMAYNQQLQDAGILRAMEGLHPPSTGRRVSFKTGKPVVTDGPFAEAKEVLGGFWIIEVDSLDEATAWAARCPADTNETIEVRRIQAMEDFEPDVQAIAASFEGPIDSGWTPKA
jgi:hypothetical protein